MQREKFFCFVPGEILRLIPGKVDMFEHVSTEEKMN